MEDRPSRPKKRLAVSACRAKSNGPGGRRGYPPASRSEEVSRRQGQGLRRHQGGQPVEGLLHALADLLFSAGKGGGPFLRHAHVHAYHR